MNARTPLFLEGHVDFAASHFEVDPSGPRPTAYMHGMLQGPVARCLFITRMPCEPDLTLAPHAKVALDLDMHVTELAALQLVLPDHGHVRDRVLTDLWIDDEVRRCWRAISEGGDGTEMLTVTRGTCVLVTELLASDRARMQAIVDLARSLAAVPHRRARELAAAVAPLGIVRQTERLQLDQTAVSLAKHSAQIVIAYAPAFDSSALQLRTSIRAPRRGAAIAPTSLPSGATFAAGDREVAITLAGWVTDPARLLAAVDVVANR
jgi:hypothetical protein